MRTGLGKKISIKIFCINAKLGFQLYETQILTKQLTPLPLRNWSSLTRSYPSI